MNKVLASELGFLGINVDSNFDLAWLKTEVADKIREGDITSIYKLINFARHSEDPAIRDYAVKIEHIYQDRVDAYEQFPVKEKKAEDKIQYEEASTVEEVEEILNGENSEVAVEITEDLNLESGKSIIIKSGKKATVKVDGNIDCVSQAFVVEDGGELILKGDGIISTNTKKGQAAISASGANAKVTIDGVTIDSFTKQGKSGNEAYGIYLSNDASLDFKSGKILTAYGSCIGTNNTTGGNTEINISGGELYSDGSYAIYLPAQGTVNITGGTIQGINARMGVFNISGNANIIPTTIEAGSCDDIGKEFKTSGCVWLGDTIAVMAGTYTDTDGTDCEINVGGNAKVNSNFRSAIGIYSVDIKSDQNVIVSVENGDNVKTTDAAFEDIKIYDHAYITEAATAQGKEYAPTAESNIVAKVAGQIIYPINNSEEAPQDNG